MIPAEVHTVLLVGVCLLTAMAVGPVSSRAARAAGVGIWVIIAVMAVAVGGVAGVPVTVVCAAVIERLARSRAITTPSPVGFIGAMLIAALAVMVGVHALNLPFPRVPHVSVAPSHGPCTAMAISSIGVLVARAVTGRG
ncbi:hypothetical protein JXA88_06480 [Candidatus Fermentibacteria bacterium]|nr:hypothetical protein [Candidatus Fermentibacteria bacterium]